MNFVKYKSCQMDPYEDDYYDPIEELYELSLDELKVHNLKDEVKYWINIMGCLYHIPNELALKLHEKLKDDFIKIIHELSDVYAVYFICLLDTHGIPFEITDELFDSLYMSGEYSIIIGNPRFTPDYEQFKMICKSIIESPPTSSHRYLEFRDFLERNYCHLAEFVQTKKFLKILIRITHKRIFRYLVNIIIEGNVPLIKLNKVIFKYILEGGKYYLNNIINLNSFICNKFLKICDFPYDLYSEKELKILLTNKIVNVEKEFTIDTVHICNLLDYRIPKSLVYMRPELFTEIMGTTEVLVKQWKINFVRLMVYQNNLDTVIYGD